MSYNGSGTFNINTAGQPVVPGTVISSTVFNALTSDLAGGLTNAVTKDGQTTPTSNLKMGGFKLTGLGAGTVATDAVNVSQLQDGSTSYLSISGVDTITAMLTPSLTSYTAGSQFSFVPSSNNTGAVTINIDSLGAKAITKNGSAALTAGDLYAGKLAVIEYDGTRFQLINLATGLYANGGTITGDGTNLLYRTNGIHYFQNVSGSNLAYIDTSGNFVATANVTAYSDARLKTDVNTIQRALDKVSAMRGVTFTKDGTSQVGVIAQEVLEVVPEAVQLNADGYYSVAYGNLVGVLIEAVKELRAEVKALKGE